ncbi:MAG TPA: ABC transporter permease [Clostridia bacterium]|nr:ABC transporter permease [Clostridia bacterium]
MLYYITKRLLYSLLTLFIIFTVIFILMHAIPGNVYSSDKALPPEIENNIRVKYGLDKPIFQQYIKSLENTATLDFGMSMKNEGREVNDIIKEHFPKSAMVGVFSIFLCLIIGLPLGIFSGLNKGKWQDNATMVLATIGVTVPSFVLGTLLQYFIGVKLGWLPTIGFNSFENLILPSIALSLFPLSFIARLVRSGMVESLEQDYIRTARAKGLTERVVILKHALKNSILPVITYLGPLAAGVLTGSFVIESIFNIPGLGRYFVDSISSRDYTVIMGVSVFYAMILILMNFIVDVVYVFVDPRIKYKN